MYFKDYFRYNYSNKGNDRKNTLKKEKDMGNMFDFLNRRDVYNHINDPHVVKKEKHALEEKNTIVIPNKREPINEKIKKLFKVFKKD